MKTLETTEFTLMVFVISMNSQYSGNNISSRKWKVLPQLKDTEHPTDDMEECLNAERFNEKFYVQGQRVMNWLHDQKNATIPSTTWVNVGDDFIYHCCDNGDVFSIYRFGLYKQGTIDPQELICRVGVKKTRRARCMVQWGSNFNTSRYNGRVFVGYNKTASCTVWTIRNVTVGDENVFISAYRDNSMDKSELCFPVVLNITKESIPTQVHTTGIHSTSTQKVPSTKSIKTVSPTQNSTSSHAMIIAVICGVLLASLVIGSLLCCKCRKRQKPRGNSRTDQDNEGNFRETSIILLPRETEERHSLYGSLESECLNDDVA